MPTEAPGISTVSKQDRVTTWVNMFGDDLFSWARHKTSNETVAEDLVQETFLSAYQSYESFQENSNAKTWLFSILNNKIIDHYRKAARSVGMEIDIDKKPTNNNDDFFTEKGMWQNSDIHMLWDTEANLLDDDNFNHVLSGCLDKLPDGWRLMVNAKYLLEKDAKEICQELNITTSNYWQVLHRSKLQLRKCIELHWFKS